MTFNLEGLIRDNIRDMKPYSSARSEYNGDDAGTIFLDANEQPAALSGLPESINRYPRHGRENLKKRIAAIRGVNTDQVFLGNGSDEAIDLILRCFARPGQDEIVVFPPTFGMYAVSAAMNDLKINRIALNEHFLIDIKKTLSAVTANTRAIFICNPNNPTGNTQPPETITQLLNNFGGLVVVDEAYMDFAPGESLLPRLNEFPNLIVLQTFSKAWGLAGARVGMAYASAEIVRVLNKVSFPYNISMPDSQLAIDALNRYAEYRLSVDETIQNRIALERELMQMPGVLHVYPSMANFLLVKTSNGNAIYKHLQSKGIIVRNRSSEPGCEDCLRVTVGSVQENKRLLDTWKNYDRPDSQHDADKTELPASLPRKAVVVRNTSETAITIRLNLDGTGRANISTGIGFLDHMLHQIARHGLFDLDILAEGDLHIDPHHTMEDTAITLGQAFRQALDDKAGIERYGFALPMDDSAAKVLIDFGGRIYFKWNVRFSSPNTGDVPSSLFEHFFRSFAEASHANLHVKAKGKDDHHKVEAVFKAFARALRMAVTKNNSGVLPSTKGML